MAPGRHIELFFLDEAVALAASHRPCAEFLLARAGAGLPGNGAEAIECHLRAPHITTDGAQARHDATIAGLPDGTLLAGTTAPRAGRGQHLLPFTPAGYGPPRAPHPDGWRPSPPPPVVAVPAAGYRPLVHPGAT